MATWPDGLALRLRHAGAGKGGIVCLTGAGIAAESGIPTFRGRDGYWTVGSRHYAPQEMATGSMFAQHPEPVWRWYLSRRAVCRAAAPNAAHAALAALERAWGDRFTLVTQNVDGLHERAGNSAARTLAIHGSLHHMRCVRDCQPAPLPLPAACGDRPGADALGDDERAALRCANCDNWMRPHVLWFDECYDEVYYRADSALAAASRAAILLVVGTSGATALPQHAARLARDAGALLVDIDPDDNPFARAAAAAGGFHLRGSASDLVPAFVERCIAAIA